MNSDNKFQKLSEDTYIWIGPRLSDINHIEDIRFDGAINVFGENNKLRNLYALCDCDTTCRIDHNAMSQAFNDFIYKALCKIVKCNPYVKFYCYDQALYYDIKTTYEFGKEKIFGDEFLNRFVCVNKDTYINCIRNKKLFRENYSFIGGGKGIIDYIVARRSECQYEKLCEIFKVNKNSDCKFILQEAISRGGNGTHILTRANAINLFNNLDNNCDYLVSIYRENNVPVNMHAIIFDDGVLFTPGSIQVMRVDYESIDGSEELRKLMYRGADFIEYERISHLEKCPDNKINGTHISKFKALCAELCEKLKETGYRGVLGIDGIIYGDEVRILEVNSRFQASTCLINRALQEKKYPSVQKINIAAMSGGKAVDFEKYFLNLKVNYSNYSYKHIDEDEHAERVFAACERGAEHVCGVEKDGFASAMSEKYRKGNGRETSAHLFRVVFNTNICWVNEDGAVNLDECVSEPVKEYKNKILNIGSDLKDDRVSPYNLLALKIALLIQGVNFVSGDIDELKKRVRPATNDAVDMLFGPQYYGAVINAPLNNKFQEFSPFELKEKDAASMKFDLYYYGVKITEVTLYQTDPLEFNYDGSLRKTKDGKYTFRDVAYLSTDRLRVHVTNECIYKKRQGKGENNSCKFCNIIPSGEDINLNAIEEVVTEHWKWHEKSGLTHFLIGGQSPVQNQETIDNIVSIIKIIKDIREGGDPNITPTLIYAMILPCDKNSIERMVAAGLTHLSFNIEIFDDNYAKKYMPGKGSISRDTYKQALTDALEVYKKSRCPEKREEAYQAVRSMVIMGLEPEKTFMEGIKWMIDNHIQPIISIFRPLKGTELSNLVAPSMISVYNLFFKLQNMIDETNGYFQKSDMPRNCFLGPDCKNCQNNTLSLPLNIKF